MSKKTQMLLYVALLAVFDTVIPILPMTALIFIYVILNRPQWFLDWIKEIYGA
jgi:hypothetical protein